VQVRQQMDLVLRINGWHMAAISAAVCVYELIAHQRLAPVAFIAHGTNTIASVATAAVLAQHATAFILTAGRVYDSREYANGCKSSKQYVAEIFHNWNLETLKYQMFSQR
jgi:hypothetical protein